MQVGESIQAAENQVRAWYLHVAASVSEGICPQHQARLEPAPSMDGRIAGWCAACVSWWWFSPGRGREEPSAGQHLAVSVTGYPLRPPEWLA